MKWLCITLIAVIVLQFQIHKIKIDSLQERIDYLLEFKTPIQPKCPAHKEVLPPKCKEPEIVEKVVEVVRDCEPCPSHYDDDYSWSFDSDF